MSYAWLKIKQFFVMLAAAFLVSLPRRKKE